MLLVLKCHLAPDFFLSKTACCGMYIRLVMISIDLSETTQKVHWKSETKFSLRQKLRIFFDKKFFLTKKKKKLLEKKFSDFVLD